MPLGQIVFNKILGGDVIVAIKFEILTLVLNGKSFLEDAVLASKIVETELRKIIKNCCYLLLQRDSKV